MKKETPETNIKQRFWYKAEPKTRLLVIMLSALLTVSATMLLVQLYKADEGITVTRQDGIYDLRGLSLSGDTLIRLAAGETYYPNVYLSPETADATVPEPAGRLEEIGAAYLSQRFVLLLPDNNDTYTLTFRLSGRHAMRVLVNGRLRAQGGHPGTTKADTEVWENNLTFHAAADGGKMDIILHSAQFYYANKAAALAQLHLGEAGAAPFASARGRGMLIMGALLGAAISLLGLYLMLARTKATLYFALSCMVMALREGGRSQAWTQLRTPGGSALPGNLSFMLEYLTLAFMGVFLCLYLWEYAKGRFLKACLLTALAGSAAYGLCVLLGDSLFYTSALKLYQLLLLLCIIPGIGGLLLSQRRPDAERTMALYGIAVFYISAAADILMYMDVFDKALPTSEVSMLIFALAQTFSLYLMNSRVLTQAQAARQEMAAEKSSLEKLSRLKTEFLSNVSHELKTPLTAVSGHAQLLGAQLSGAEHAAARDKSRIISSEADRLALMVGQVLDVTRIEENRLTVEKSLCHIDELIYRAVETHFPILNKGNNRLEINAGLDLPEVECDPGRITQVLVNLIANALRHTRQGVISVTAKASDGLMEVAVSDTGSGMSPKELSNLFTRYRPGTGETGSGLGLYICKYLVEEHGGAIRVESAEGEGTAVTFSLPLRSM